MGHHFLQWSDGNTDNPRVLDVTQDIVLTALFVPNQYSITVSSADESLGSVSGSGTYYYNDTITLEATAIPHHHFTHWSDGNTENPRQYIVSDDVRLSAYFTIDEHTVSVSSNDIVRGMVTSTGTMFEYGQPCTVEAIAYTGYTFAGWSNGVTTTPYTFAVVDDVVLVANFIDEALAIQEPSTEKGYAYASGDAIVIEYIKNTPVQVYDMMGRTIASTQLEGYGVKIAVPTSGVYLVKIGAMPVQRVLVVK